MTLGVMPVTISIVVGLIGFFGLASAIYAAHRIGREKEKLTRGRGSLRDLAVGLDRTFNYRQWLKERSLDDSHFADHLLAASDAAKSGRAISLHELHQISARREASCRSARLSGGVTGLLLICGIAGTLFCIKPILEGFQFKSRPDAVTDISVNLTTATDLIQGLSQAFLPSLVALVLTVLVAFARGFYTHGRGMLAGELDQLDLEELFGRFPPPSVSRELDEVRAQLGELVVQMISSQRNFDGFINRLAEAAQGFGNHAPSLTEASSRFVGATNQIVPKFDDLLKALSANLGADAPLCVRLGNLDAVSQQVATASEQIKVAGTVLTKHLQISHEVLKQVATDLPAQIQVGCQTASTIIADAAATAIATACTDAARSLDAAAAPVRLAAKDINSANQALRTDIAESLNGAVEDLHQNAESIKQDVNATGQLMLDEVTKALDTVAGDMHERCEAMEEDFRRSLDKAVVTISTMYSSASTAIDKVSAAIVHLDQLQSQFTLALDEYAEGRKEAALIRTDIQSTAAQIKIIGEHFQTATTDLGDVKRTAEAIANRLQTVTSEIEKLTTTSREIFTGLKVLKGETALTINHLNDLIKQAGQAAEKWKTLFNDTDRLLQSGGSLSEDLARVLENGKDLQSLLERATANAKEQQQQLAERLAANSDALIAWWTRLKEEIDHLEKAKVAGWVSHLFGRKR